MIIDRPIIDLDIFKGETTTDDHTLAHWYMHSCIASGPLPKMPKMHLFSLAAWRSVDHATCPAFTHLHTSWN